MILFREHCLTGARTYVTRALLLLLSWCAANHALGDPTSVPVGLWAWQFEAPPAAHSVLLQRAGEDWSAKVDGQAVPVAVKPEGIELELDNGEKLIGSVDASGEFAGQWYQPPQSAGYYSAMATPVRMTATSDNRWEATIDVQARPFRVFLDVFVDEAGSAEAVIRNPERNNIQNAVRFSVRAKGDDAWSLTAQRGSRTIRRSLRRVDPESLILEYEQIDEDVVLHRATPEDQRVYFSRAPNSGSRSYEPPPQLADGWQTASAAEHGFDIATLDQMVNRIAGHDPRDSRPVMMHSLLVAHRGHMVVEEYFHGYGRDDRHDSRSLAKVFGSMLVGGLQQASYAVSPDDTPIPAIFANRGESIDDPRKAEITLAHLMSYTSGLDAHIAEDTPGNEDNLWANGGDDFWLYTAKLPLIYPPGERYAYASASANLVGAAIAAAVDKPIRTLFDELFAVPLGFGPYHWNLTPGGRSYLGGGVYLRPRDLLKLGSVYAGGGQWQGRQLVSEDWIAESTKVRIAVTPETTRMTPEAFNNDYFLSQQAYIWHVHDIEVEGRRYRSFENSGNGGQLLIVVPELELAVVFNGGNYGMGYIWGRWRDEFIGGYLIPALLSDASPASNKTALSGQPLTDGRDGSLPQASPQP